MNRPLRIGVAMGLLSFVGWWFFLHGSDKLNWQGFTSEDGRFTILMPGEPVASTNPKGGITSFKVTLSRTAYEVSYADPSLVDIILGPLSLDQFKDSWKRKNFTVTTVSEWMFEGDKGWELEARSNESPDQYYSGRGIVVEKRMYEAKVTGTDARLSNPNVRTFLASFVPWRKRVEK